MELRMLLHVKFNRTVDLEKDYIVAGGFEMVMDGTSYEFDFHNQYHNLVHGHPDEDVITLYNPDYSDFKEFKNVEVVDLQNITEIKECYVYLGEPEESDLKVVSVENIYFTVIDKDYIAISVDRDVISAFNAQTEQDKSIIRAAFTSVWDGNTITTPCDINAKTKEIVYIEKSPVELQGSCEREYVTIKGRDFDAHGGHNLENTEDEYWYDAVPAQFVRLDRCDRPVYELPDGRFIKDVDPRQQFEPTLYYSCNNDVDGEPDDPVNDAVKLLPKRITW